MSTAHHKTILASAVVICKKQYILKIAKKSRFFYEIDSNILYVLYLQSTILDQSSILRRLFVREVLKFLN